jgi:hypothetical protein
MTAWISGKRPAEDATPQRQLDGAAAVGDGERVPFEEHVCCVAMGQADLEKTALDAQADAHAGQLRGEAGIEAQPRLTVPHPREAVDE